jgi:hypothetical protein
MESRDLRQLCMYSPSPTPIFSNPHGLQQEYYAVTQRGGKRREEGEGGEVRLVEGERGGGKRGGGRKKRLGG